MTQSAVVTDSETSESVYATATASSSDSYKGNEYNSDSECRQRRKVEQGFINLVNNWKDAVKPWSEFFNISSFGLPLPVKYLLKRIKKNVSYFPANYVVVVLLLAFCCIITSFWLLISTILIAMIFAFIRSKTSKGPLIIGGEEIPSWFLYSAAVFAIIPLLILADVGYLLYCAVGISMFLILIHASFYSGPPTKKVISKKEKVQVVVQKSKKTIDNEELLHKNNEAVSGDSTKNPRVRFTEAETL